MRLASLLLLTALSASPAALSAQTPAAGQLPEVTLKEEKAGLARQAGITDSAARKAALAKVPGGSIVQAEIEQEKGKLIYSYDIKVTGAEGIQEVAVDAHTGRVLSVEHESAADEAREAAEDAKKKPT